MVAADEERNLSLNSIVPKWSKGDKRTEGLEKLADIMKELQSRLDFKQGARDWCYFLEGERRIRKGEFDRAQRTIVDARIAGLFPYDFFLEDDKRAWDVVEKPTTQTYGHSVVEFFKLYLDAALHCIEDHFVPDYWAGEKYYLQTLVEKQGLKSLFLPVSQDYHVPIANAGGQPDLNQRIEMALRYRKAWKERGQIGVLPCCYDFDPWSKKLSRRIGTHISRLVRITGYRPLVIDAELYEENQGHYDDINKRMPVLVVDRFGLNEDFIKKHNLVWIDNLETSGGYDMTKSRYCNHCELQHAKNAKNCRECGKKLYNLGEDPDVKQWIAKYGERKVEANAVMKVYNEGRQLYRSVIWKYLGRDSISRFEEKRREVMAEFEWFKRDNKSLFRRMEILAGAEEEDLGE